MDFKAAIFDFDGTIADSMPMWADFASRFVKHMGAVPRPGLDKLVNAMSVQEAEVYLNQEYFKNFTAQEVHEAVDAYVTERYQKGFAPKKGIMEFIKALSERGVVMCIATATDRKPVSLALNALGLSSYFEFIITCTDVGVGKNHSPAVFDFALQKLGAKKEQTLIFEDSLYAARTACAAGYTVAGVYDDFSSQKKDEMKKTCKYYFEDFLIAKEELL